MVDASNNVSRLRVHSIVDRILKTLDILLIVANDAHSVSDSMGFVGSRAHSVAPTYETASRDQRLKVGELLWVPVGSCKHKSNAGDAAVCLNSVHPAGGSGWGRSGRGEEGEGDDGGDG
jgi:hypothetical protein